MASKRPDATGVLQARRDFTRIVHVVEDEEYKCKQDQTTIKTRGRANAKINPRASAGGQQAKRGADIKERGWLGIAGAAEYRQGLARVDP